MAHKEQFDFIERVKRTLPNFFRNVSVLEIGSLDVNGNSKIFYEQPFRYVGVDLFAGQNVDVISPGHLYNAGHKFDVVSSFECFEHDMYYPQTLKNMIKHLKRGGLLIFTCASDGRPEHGTLRTKPEDAPFLPYMSEEWANYYKNLNETDIRKILNVDKIFSFYKFEYNPISHDLYFFGVKK